MATPVIMFLLVLLLAVSANARFPIVKFGYVGGRGPSMWGKLSPDFEACSGGKLQSPIDIVERKALWFPNMEPLIRDYNSTSASLVDNGFNIAVQWANTSAGILSIEGKNYSLTQMHWHSPSEHTINGIRYAAELHLVHRSVDGNISVVSILYRLGKPDPFLVQLNGCVTQLVREVHEGHADDVPIGIVRIGEVKKHCRKYYRYTGSLTVPPCTERVIWNILGERDVKGAIAFTESPPGWGLQKQCEASTATQRPPCAHVPRALKTINILPRAVG